MSRIAVIVVAAIGLVVSMLLLSGLAYQAAQSAACVERARYLLISCIAPPDALTWALAIAMAAAFAVGVGMAFRTPGRR